MYEYIIGKVISIYELYIVIETNNIAYKIYVTNSKFNKDENIKIYLHQYINDSVRILFGFTNKLEKEVFNKLIQVKNIGVKTAFSILNKVNYQDLINAAFSDDKEILLNIPKINKDNINLVIKKVLSININEINLIDKTYLNALRVLEYPDNLIYKSYEKIDKNLSINDQIKMGIKYIEEGDLS